MKSPSCSSVSSTLRRISAIATLTALLLLVPVVVVIQSTPDRLIANAALLLFVLLLAISMAWLIAERLQRRVLFPLSSLGSVVERALREGDYGLRASFYAAEELDRIVAGCNGLLEQLERQAQRDGWYLSQKERLEQQCEERCAHQIQANLIIEQQLRQAESARRAAEHVLDVADQVKQAKSQLLANLIHEIQTHLGGVLGIGELMLGTDLPSDQRRLPTALIRSGQSLRMAIKDMLDVAQIEAGRMRLGSGDFVLADCIEEALAGLADRARARSVELVARLDPDLPHAVRGDQVRLAQVLGILGSAAIRVAQDTEILVRASLDGSSGERATIRVEVRLASMETSVRDSGSAFEDFSLLGLIATTSVDTNLGLSIARDLIALMGGTPGVLDDPGHGEGVWFSLPVTVSHWDLPWSAARAHLSGMRMVLVGPSDQSREAMSAYAAEAGILVYECSEASEAREVLCESHEGPAPFDLLVVDSALRDLESLLSSVSLAETRALDQVARVLLVSAGDDWGEDRGAGLIVDARLVKPVRREQMISTLASVTRSGWDLPEIGEDAALDLGNLEPLGIKVLVADDNAINQDLVMAMLAALGCESRAVFDGQAVIDACAAESFDAVLMDCKMPMMDGYEAARRLRLREHGGNGRRLPIIALTAHAMEGDQERCQAAGMDDYLTKPVSLRSMHRTLLRCVGRGSGIASVSGASGRGAIGLQGARAASSAPAETGPFGLDDLEAMPLLDPRVLDEVGAIDLQSGSALVTRMIASYLDSESVLVARIRDGVEAGQPQQVAECVQALRSAAKTLGAMRLTALCDRLERASRGGGPFYPSAQVAISLERTAAETRRAISQRSSADAATADAQVLERLPASSPPSIAPTAIGSGSPGEAPGGESDASGSYDRHSGRDRPLILVVDEDPGTHLVAQSTFDTCGFRFAGVRDGQGAFEAVRFQRPDLIVLDVMAPVMDGYETCRRFRRLPGFELIPILMVTGLDDLSAVEAAYDSGATDFYPRPVNWSLLVHRIRYLLRSHGTLAALHLSEARNAALIAAIPDVLMRLDRQGRVLQIKSGPILDKGLDGVETGSRTLSDLLPESVAASIQRELETALPELGLRELEIEVPVEDDEIRAFDVRLIAVDAQQVILLLRDMTEKRRRQRVIHQLAYQDSLTGLANRQQFNQDLASALALSRRRDDRLALLYLDLDRFKRINDSLGHGIGDELLRGAAKRLREAVDEVTAEARVRGSGRGANVANTVARLGGDELTVILKGYGVSRVASRVAEHVIERFREPFHCSGHSIVCTVSIGIALSPEDGETAETLLKHADTALYAAKLDGRNLYRFFTASMGESASLKLDIESRLRRALDRGDFRLLYQPIHAVGSGEILGVETLLRWHDEDRGWVEPGEFIAVAEESGLILPIGEWVIEELSRQYADWSRDGVAFPVSLNLSDCQFSDQGLINRLIRIAKERPRGTIELEIGESLLLARDARLIETLGLLRDHGLRIAVDNFGTGYSSLSQLKQLPIDTLKIGRAFVREIGREPTSELLVRTFIALGREIGLRVVAEGVETQEQYRFLEREGCDAVQGPLLASPLAPDQLAQGLAVGALPVSSM
ncbi:EAL domain-containing protein [Imhoffiella purpurea]|uniref:histidine kinase n=1 Tax=Imhoffiella purpurea TaxID=1249627 RepID=W9VIL9_9GAMM|nr:EAL domain-containing protein [Imhoffiella purpurea]EXJ15897.1 hypothetical protein D779_0761 [Imhoffiella purpurea]